MFRAVCTRPQDSTKYKGVTDAIHTIKIDTTWIDFISIQVRFEKVFIV